MEASYCVTYQHCIYDREYQEVMYYKLSVVKSLNKLILNLGRTEGSAFDSYIYVLMVLTLASIKKTFKTKQKPNEHGERNTKK